MSLFTLSRHNSLFFATATATAAAIIAGSSAASAWGTRTTVGAVAVAAVIATVHAATAVADMNGAVFSCRDRTAENRWTALVIHFGTIVFGVVLHSNTFFLLFVDGSRRCFG